MRFGKHEKTCRFDERFGFSAPLGGAFHLFADRVMGLEDFTDEDIAALEQTRAPEASTAFDGELKSS